MENGSYFQITEYFPYSNNVYNTVRKFELDLKLTIERTYIEFVYEFIIQISKALIYSHKNDTPHGNFDLKSVLVRDNINNKNEQEYKY